MPDNTASTKPRVALVGHCGPDSFALRTFIGSALPGSTIEFVNEQTDTETRLADFDALLVNRVLDGSFKTESGIELIRALATLDNAPSLMLISNFADAQAEAEAAGATKGFGKSELNTDPARSALRAAVGQPA